MSLAADLLAQALMLAELEPKKPKQASLRRAVSAAYYSLFHLPVDDAARLFVRDDFARIALIARSFDHGKMKEVASHFLGNDLPERIRLKLVYQTPPELRVVAEAFVKLQQLRHEADYNVNRQFTRSEVQQLIRDAETALVSWNKVRNTDDARMFLACFSLWDSWNKRR